MRPEVILLLVGGVAAAGITMVWLTPTKSGKKPAPAPEQPNQPAPSEPVPAPAPAPPAPPSEVPANPGANWGAVPAQWRKHFLEIEKIAAVPGSARLFAVLGWAGSRYDQFKHDQGLPAMSYSTAVFDALKDQRPPLKYAAEARKYGTGGLYNMAASECLWTGYKQLGNQAPTLAFHPQVVSTINASTFSIAVRIQDIQELMLPEDGMLEYAAAMMSPFLFAQDRNSWEVAALKQQFQQAATELGIDLAQLPQRYEASGGWPGVLPTYQAAVKLGYPTKPNLGGLGS